MIIDLINNAALLLAICWLQSLISNRWQKETLRAQLFSGVLFSIATITVMLTSILIQPGLWLWTDSGSVVVSVASLLYGPIAGGLAALAGIAYKLWIGGLVSVGGVVTLLISFAAGLALRALYKRFDWKLDWIKLLLFGLIVHGIGAWQLYYFHLPPHSQISAGYFITLLAIMGPTTALLGLQLQYIERKSALERQIKRNERRLQLITQSIPDQLIIANGDGVLSDVITPAALADRIGHRLGQRIESFDPEAYKNHYAVLLHKAVTTGEPQTEVYASDRRQLLGEKTDGEILHFESKAQKISGLDDREEVIVLTRDITERVKAEEEIHFLAHYDTLTGLPNRHKTNQAIDKAIENHEATGTPFTLVIFYLTDFNLFNQSLGARAGDYLLREVSKRLHENFGKEYFLARYSGLEFVLLRPGLTDIESLARFCQDIHMLLERPIEFEGALLKMGASIGTADYPRDCRSKSELLRKASLALQVAHENKIRPIVHYHHAMDTTFQEMLWIRKSLTKALENQELDIYFQPFYTFHDDKLYGVEALIRWTHPKLGVQDPGFFLQAAEKSGLITSIGAWGIERACQRAKELEAAGLGPVTLSVNISLIQLADYEFPRLLNSILGRTDFDPQRIILEISEPEIIKNLSNIYETTAKLAEMGVRLAIDNFGSGFTNLNLIKEIGVRFLKISPNYITDIETDVEKRSIVTALIQIAKSLDIKTVAVGVEDEHGRNMLESLGVDMGQGYYYCRPLPMQELAPRIKAAQR